MCCEYKTCCGLTSWIGLDNILPLQSEYSRSWWCFTNWLTLLALTIAYGMLVWQGPSPMQKKDNNYAESRNSPQCGSSTTSFQSIIQVSFASCFIRSLICSKRRRRIRPKWEAMRPARKSGRPFINNEHLFCTSWDCKCHEYCVHYKTPEHAHQWIRRLLRSSSSTFRWKSGCLISFPHLWKVHARSTLQVPHVKNKFAVATGRLFGWPLNLIAASIRARHHSEHRPHTKSSRSTCMQQNPRSRPVYPNLKTKQL